jgi:hypothetical protein
MDEDETAGVQAPPLAAVVAKATGAEQDRAGRLCVNDDLTIAGHPDILVTGDMMSLDKLPGVAKDAMQQGHYAGRSAAPSRRLCLFPRSRNMWAARFGRHRDYERPCGRGRFNGGIDRDQPIEPVKSEHPPDGLGGDHQP